VIRQATHCSRKARRCDSCRGSISAGQHYIESVISPGHGDVGNETWWRAAECRECAERYGRGHLLPRAEVAAREAGDGLASLDDVDAWHLWRSQGIGGSDVAAALGISPWSSPYALWAEKVGLTTREHSATEAQEFGLRAEKMLAEWFHDKTGLYVLGQQQWAVHPDKPWMRVTLDGFVGESPNTPLDLALGAYEAKTTPDSPAEWDQQVPVYYQCQAVWLMLVTGTTRCWFSVLHHGFANLYRIYEFQLDEADAAYVADRCERFWLDHVVAGIPPDTDAHQATTDALNSMWPDATGQMDADDNLVALASERDQWKQTIDTATEQVERINNLFRLALGDVQDLKYQGKNLATWRWGKETSKFDLAGLLADHPEYADLYKTPPTRTRTLRVNVPKTGE